RAADNHILYRETVRAVAFKHGYFASFAPKPWPDQAGNGCHVHLSVWDPTGEENLFFDRSAPYQLGRLGQYFAAGLLEHLPGLAGIIRRWELSDAQLPLVDPATISDEEREERGIRRLPDSLSSALDALEADTVLTDALGPLLTTSYLTVRRSEWSAFSTQGSA